MKNGPAPISLPSLGRTLRFLWPYTSNERMPMAGSLMVLLLSVALRLLEPWPLKFLFDQILEPPGGTSGPRLGVARHVQPGVLLFWAAAALALIVAARSFAEYVHRIVLLRIGNAVVTQLRNDLYRHIQRLSLAFHSRSRSGDLTLRIMSDVNLLRDVAVTSLVPLLASVLSLGGMAVVMVAMNWKLGLLALAPVPLFAVSAARLTGRIRHAAAVQRAREGHLASSAAESIGAIKTVQALSLEQRFASGFQKQNRDSQTNEVKTGRLSARLERSVDVLIGISTALVIFYGGRLVLSGALTAGSLLVFINYLRRAFNPIQDFAKYTGRLAKASAAGERVLSILEQEPEMADRPGAVPAPPLSGAIDLENVTFSYVPGVPVLEEFTLSIPPGRRVALVGASGIGKSTVTNLVLRLYEPQSGRVLFDGVDARQLTLASVRAQISIVLQESVLFATSVWENIGLAASDASRDEIVAAARVANAHEFILRLPKGYDSILGERGTTLSGGERQRIAIARAALRNAPILLLDEPTSGLDEENHRAVSDALLRVSRGRTTLLATHDLELASSCDEIVYIDRGRIAERGTHQQLIKAGGRYAELYRLQMTLGTAASETAHA